MDGKKKGFRYKNGMKDQGLGLPRSICACEEENEAMDQKPRTLPVSRGQIFNNDTSFDVMVQNQQRIG